MVGGWWGKAQTSKTFWKNAGQLGGWLGAVSCQMIEVWLNDASSFDVMAASGCENAAESVSEIENA